MKESQIASKGSINRMASLHFSKEMEPMHYVFFLLKHWTSPLEISLENCSKKGLAQIALLWMLLQVGQQELQLNSLYIL